MGRGDYLGGSTVIGPRSGWFSGVGSQSGKQPNQSKSSRESQREAHRIHYIHMIIQAELAGKDPPPLPKKAKAHMKAAVDRKGGALPWAKSQPEYLQLRDKKFQKKNRNEKSREAFVEVPKRGLQYLDRNQDISDNLIIIHAAMDQITSLMKQIADRQDKIAFLLSGKVEHDI